MPGFDNIFLTKAEAKELLEVVFLDRIKSYNSSSPEVNSAINGNTALSTTVKLIGGKDKLLGYLKTGAQKINDKMLSSIPSQGISYKDFASLVDNAINNVKSGSLNAVGIKETNNPLNGDDFYIYQLYSGLKSTDILNSFSSKDFKVKHFTAADIFREELGNIPQVTKKAEPPKQAAAAPKKIKEKVTGAQKWEDLPLSIQEGGNPVVIIDVGHGWTGKKEDIGAVNGSFEEYNENLEHSKALRDALKARGITAILTSDERSPENTTDNFPSRYKVVKKYKEQGNNVFLYISNHVDSNDSDKSMGITCYYDKDEKFEETVEVAELISKSCGSKSGPFRKTERNAPIRKKENGVDTDIADIPAVLIEWGNMQAKEDQKNLNNPVWINNKVNAIADAIKLSYEQILTKERLQLKSSSDITEDDVLLAKQEAQKEAKKKLDEENNFSAATSLKNLDAKSLATSAYKSDIWGMVSSFFTGENGMPATTLFTMIIRFFESIFDLLKNSKEIDIPDQHKEMIAFQVTKDCAMAVLERAKELKLDTDNSRLEFVGEAFKNFNEAKDKIMQEASQLFAEEVKAIGGKEKLTNENLAEINGKLATFLTDKIKTSFGVLAEKDFVVNPLEKDGKTAYFDSKNDVLQYFTKEEITALGNSSYQKLSEFDGVYWPLHHVAEKPEPSKDTKLLG